MAYTIANLPEVVGSLRGLQKGLKRAKDIQDVKKEVQENHLRNDTPLTPDSESTVEVYYEALYQAKLKESQAEEQNVRNAMNEDEGVENEDKSEDKEEDALTDRYIRDIINEILREV